jgi:hypothetical protein
MIAGAMVGHRRSMVGHRRSVVRHGGTAMSFLAEILAMHQPIAVGTAMRLGTMVVAIRFRPTVGRLGHLFAKFLHPLAELLHPFRIERRTMAVGKAMGERSARAAGTAETGARARAAIVVALRLVALGFIAAGFIAFWFVAAGVLAARFRTAIGVRSRFVALHLIARRRRAGTLVVVGQEIAGQTRDREHGGGKHR